MRVDDRVTWQGRIYVLRGFDPMSIPDRGAEVDDPVSGARIRVPVDQLRPAPATASQDQDRPT
jgi:hypothetical protein